MLLTCGVILASLYLASSSHQGNLTATFSNRQPVQYPRIYLFGDSLTQLGHSAQGCWGSIVANTFQRKCDVVLRGYSGYNTRAGKHVLRRVFGPEDAGSVAAFVVMLGTNDAAEPEDGGGNHVPLDEYAANLGELLDYIRSCGVPDSKVVLITPPPLDEERWKAHTGRRGRPTRRLETTKKYAELCLRVGKERGITTVDSFNGLLKQSNWRSFFAEGLHFSTVGSQKFAKLLMPTLVKAVGNVIQIFPDFKNLDPSNPGRGIDGWKPRY